ncbi:MAG: hypothetical protein ABSG25_15995 [Bryobacteraceae bacterium]
MDTSELQKTVTGQIGRVMQHLGVDRTPSHGKTLAQSPGESAAPDFCAAASPARLDERSAGVSILEAMR